MEWVHRRHERVQLQEDLRTELEQNQDMIRNDVAVLDRHMVWLTSWNAAVQEARDHRVPLTRVMPEYGFTQNVGQQYSLPSAAVWSVAQHAMTVGLLPRDQAEAFDRTSTVREKMVDGFSARVGIYRERLAFEARFTNASAPTVPVCSRMSSEELDAYSALLMREFEAVRLEELYQLYLFGVDRAVLEERYSQREMAQGMYSGVADLWHCLIRDIRCWIRDDEGRVFARVQLRRCRAAQRAVHGRNFSLYKRHATKTLDATR